MRGRENGGGRRFDALLIVAIFLSETSYGLRIKNSLNISTAAIYRFEIFLRLFTYQIKTDHLAFGCEFFLNEKLYTDKDKGESPPLNNCTT